MTIELRYPTIRVEPAPGRPPTQQPPRACDRCGGPQSTYRHPAELVCSSCARYMASPMPVCPGCGRSEDWDEDHGLCRWCVAESQGKKGTRCESCGKVYGLRGGSKSGSTRRCSACRTRQQAERRGAEQHAEWHKQRYARQIQLRLEESA